MNTDKPMGLLTPRGPIPLQAVEISGEVFGACARVRVAQRYRNEETQPIEAIYTFPLPSDATLVGFAMACAGRRIDGVIRERDEAFRQYDEAISAGHGAALLEPERPNIFTAQVGNLLPGEETLIELDYLQRLTADEGTLRWSIPTLVAPRYIPGHPAGDRTGHGWADPTARVPDADRITPPIGAPKYGVKVDLLFDACPDAVVESPSHAIRMAREGERIRVSFAEPQVALDRDVILTLRHAAEGPLTALAVHREGSGPGVFALTVVPDLFDPSTGLGMGESTARTSESPALRMGESTAVRATESAPRIGKSSARTGSSIAVGESTAPAIRESTGPSTGPGRQTVVFLIDVSGSMNGASIVEARAALRLCLRHLREGERFNIIAFNNQHRLFSEEPVSLSQVTLERADRWVDALKADGGTELLEPLIRALEGSPDLVMLLTDGQVGNESEILSAAERARGKTRVYSFGIGTNVSDVLLRDLARRTSGGVEFIHPGERVDEKVVAQFARAIAPRIQDMRVSFHGVEVKELAPESPPALIDGDPWLLMGRYAAPGRGHVEIRGQLRGEPFLLKVPIELADHASRPHLLKLWARERIRDLEDAQLGGRPAEAVRDRILKLALEHSLASRYTSFLAIEQRTDERRATGHPQTRVVPVHAPAGWAMFEGKDELWPSVIPMGRARTRGAIASAARGLTMAAMAPGAAKARGGITIAGFAPPMAAEPVSRDEGQGDGMLGIGFAAGVRASPSSASRSEEDAVSKLLRTQLASGLWPDGSGASEAQQVRATALALLELVRAGITTAHSQHGAQIRKAIEALLERLARAKTGKLIELAFAVALLAASGPRTRSRIKREISGRSDLGSLRAQLNSEPALRARADALAADV